ncbi:MAG: OsmC family protein [Blastocatellia bacterium]|nr:OsmC family protein [Blastocatellia bacterium]
MKLQLPLYYEVEVSWTESQVGKVVTDHAPAVVVAPPPDFGGPEGVWSPEQLFVAAINSCFMATFLNLATHGKLNFVSFTCKAAGKLDRVESGGLQITNVALNPVLVIAADADLEQARRILEKAKHHCLITNSVKSNVKLDMEVMYE